MMLLSGSVTSSGTLAILCELFCQDYFSFAHTGHESWAPMADSCNVTSGETLKSFTASPLTFGKRF